MSTLNPFFTFHYSQPEEYRFSHDSVFLARRVFEILVAEGFQGRRALDLCAGCGVVGLDFLFHCESHAVSVVKDFDFLEVQEVYQSHFIENRRQARVSPDRAQFLLGTYADLGQQGPQYDLLLCNPPYFRPGQGKMSPSEFKNRCRFFIDSDFPTLLRAMADCLRDDGRAYFLLRDLEDHGFDAQKEATEILGPQGILTRLGDIRGTSLMYFKRNPRQV